MATPSTSALFTRSWVLSNARGTPKRLRAASAGWRQLVASAAPPQSAGGRPAGRRREARGHEDAVLSVELFDPSGVPGVQGRFIGGQQRAQLLLSGGHDNLHRVLRDEGQERERQ